jgi:DNA-binding NarL/FixJ family response regulator
MLQDAQALFSRGLLRVLFIPMSTTKLTVLVAHGEPLMQLGLESALGRCEDLHLQTIAEKGQPLFDVAVSDLDNGIALARRAQGCVLIVTSDESEVGIRSAVEAGVRGYLLSGSTPESVIQAVRRVAWGGTAIEPCALAKMIDSLKGDRLTDRELDVLRLIVLGRPNKVVANELGISVGTVKSHMKQLMTKLNARSRTEAASIAQRRGLVPRQPAAAARALLAQPQ